MRISTKEIDIIIRRNTKTLLARKDSKLKHLPFIKPYYHISEYLAWVSRVSDRISISKLRLSNHDLEIERERYKNIERNKRFCSHCVMEVEDEMHFLLSCNRYNSSRNKLFKEVQLVHTNLNILSKEDKFLFLMACRKSIANSVGAFITKAFELRQLDIWFSSYSSLNWIHIIHIFAKYPLLNLTMRERLAIYIYPG